jgi:uncharacterized protein (DUF305 family)
MKSLLCRRRSFLALFALMLGLTSIGFADAPAPERDQRRFEVEFLKAMIDHHYGAIKMSELCKGRTVHPELQEMCDMVIANQSAEIKKMQEWLKAWYGESETPSLTSKARRQVEYLSRLICAEFEKAYMSILIEHHSMAVRMALECLNEAYHAEMLDMCAKMMAMQGDEIMQLRLWLMQWYGINDLDRNDRT